MKRVFLICLMVLTGLQLKAQEKKVLNSYISYATFNVTGENPYQYIETYITFDRESLVYVKNADGQYEAEINITLLLKQGEAIKNFGKYTVKSPVEIDTANINGFFMDAQRYILPNGTYTLEVTMEDVNNKTEKPFTIEDEVVVDFPDNFCISSILGLESYAKSEKESACTKNGYDLIPMIMPYYPENMNKLTFYAEIYNAKKQLGEDEKYLLNTYISTFETNTKVNNFAYAKRMNAKDTEVIINSMDISGLPSGNYYLVLEARNRNNEVIGLNRFFFQRSNNNYQIDPTALESINTEYVFSGRIKDIDTIREYIRTLYAISSEVERQYAENLVKTDDIRTMQQFFYTFWSSRNQIDPEEQWNEYYKQVQRVNASFSTSTKKGYRSDRGIVFLKYGTPDRIVESYNEPGAYPYEIWHYYTLGNQRNKKFVFMTRDIVTNDFYQIHSDAVGELSNYRWSNEIYFRTYGTYYDYNVDGTVNPNSYGDKAVDYYNNPR